MGEFKGSGKGMGFQGNCYTCGKPGHTSRECWAKGSGKAGKGKGYGPVGGKGSMRTLDDYWPSQVQPLSALRETPVKNMFKELTEEDDAEEQPEKSGRCQSQGSPRYDHWRESGQGPGDRGIAPARRQPPTDQTCGLPATDLGWSVRRLAQIGATRPLRGQAARPARGRVGG